MFNWLTFWNFLLSAHRISASVIVGFLLTSCENDEATVVLRTLSGAEFQRSVNPFSPASQLQLILTSCFGFLLLIFSCGTFQLMSNQWNAP